MVSVGYTCVGDLSRCDCTCGAVSLLSEATGAVEDTYVTHLRRVNAEVLKRIKSDEDVADVGVNLQLIISPLEVADYCLL